jgi:hypothetical protein
LVSDRELDGVFAGRGKVECRILLGGTAQTAEAPYPGTGSPGWLVGESDSEGSASPGGWSGKSGYWNLSNGNVCQA